MITTLENISLTTLTATFNTAFAGYYVPINTSEAGMQQRIRRTRIDLAQSVGVMDGKELVAFMLMGIGEQARQMTAYNGGTGVVPAFRGQRLVKAMYDWALPKWRQNGLQRASLEVIAENTKAIRAYQRVGFTLGRRLRAFKKDITAPVVVADNLLSRVSDPAWDHYATLQPFDFTWDYTRVGIEALENEYEYYEWGQAGAVPDAYAIVHQIGRIAQAGRQETGPAWEALLGSLESHYPQLSWVNLDDRAPGLRSAIRKLNWEHIIDQYEMERTI